MKLNLTVGLALVLSCVWTNCFGADGAVQIQLEKMAGTYGHFSLTVVIRNRPLRLWNPMEEIQPGTNSVAKWQPRKHPLALEQLELAQELRALSGHHKILADLLKNPNPKVRTLALGAIFEGEDGRDLPLIATLINDPAPTFPDLHDSMSSAGGPRPMSELERPQSVGNVAQAMLTFWGVPQNGSVSQLRFDNDSVGNRVTLSDFTEYWKRYAGRNYSASWFAVKMKRATRQATPIQPEYRTDLNKVLVEMKTLPLPDRAWIQLYVLAPQGWFEFQASGMVITDGELIAMAKKLSPASRLRFLQRQKISNDPDLLLGRDSRDFIRVSNFMLRHADKLLRAKDADALLACEYVEHDSGGVNPAWAIGAALIRPDRAGVILHKALARETRSYEVAAGQLAGALWRIRGLAELDFFVHWFYTILPTASEPMHQPVVFLWGVAEAARPDTQQLMSALVRDSRFNDTDWETLKEILKIVNANRATPLVKQSDIYDVRTGDLVDQKVALAAWRNLLRREYNLPEQKLPKPEAKAKQVVPKPIWSIALEGTPSLIVASADGNWLGMLTNRIITIWKPESGKFWWRAPSEPTAGVLCMAFEPEGQRVIGFDVGEYGRFSEWNVATRQSAGHVGITGKPTGGVDQGAYSFDRAGLRAVFSGNNDLACFDTRSGKSSWLHQGKGGVHSLVALSADGTRLAIGGGAEGPRVVTVYDAVSGNSLWQLDRNAGPMLALALSSDGNHLATASTADGIRLWDTRTGTLLKEYAYRVPSWGMSAPVFSPDGRWLAVVGSSAQIGESRVGVFNVESGELEWEIQLRADESVGPKIPLSFAADGKVLYTGARRLEAWLLLEK